MECQIECLSDADVKIMKPIRIHVDHLGKADYLAFVCDANLGASGDTEEEVIANLQDMIAVAYRLLNRFSTSGLGPEMLRLRDFLRSHLCRPTHKKAAADTPTV